MHTWNEHTGSQHLHTKRAWNGFGLLARLAGWSTISLTSNDIHLGAQLTKAFAGATTLAAMFVVRVAHISPMGHVDNR